ncbi:MAG TPA: translocation/assembly module TamB domain-containing protein [Bryobacteraceae bacterium]|nr:translocation/assembly module TamB domain-containing protein [Bryobacteraceae bacterium]
MSRRARRIWIVMGSLAALGLALALGAILVLRSDWFRGKVRQRIVAEVEKATGGRAEIAAFHFDWKRMRAEVDGFVLHGSEPPGDPPLARADAIVVGIRIVSLWKREADLQYLEVRRPQIYAIVYPDGHTNLPSPKVRRTGKSTVETILDLAIGRLSLEEGSFEVAGQGKTPFDAQGRNLRAQFDYDVAGPRYSGQVSMAPAQFQWGGYRPVPLDVKLALAVEKNRVRIDSGHLASGQAQVDFSGAIDSLADAAGAFQYTARAPLGDVTRTLGWRTQLEGAVTLAGKASFHGSSQYQASGSLRAADLLFRPDPHFLLRNLRADGSYSIDPRRVAVSGLRFEGLAMAALTGTERALEPFPVSGHIEDAVLRGKTLDAGGVHLAALDGSFNGKAGIVDLRHVHAEGDVAGFDVREMLRVYNGQSVPWDAAASGPVQLSVTLGDTRTLRLAAHMAIAPAGPGQPVHGAIDAAYDAAAETLDLGKSFLALPSTRLDFSGVLGRQLRVHADSRDLDEVLPALNVQSLPVKLQSGEAVFDGAVAGKPEDPHITGHGSATNLVWSGRTFTALSGDIDLTSEGLTVHNGNVQQGALRAQVAGSLGMRDWKVEDTSQVSAAGSIKNAPATDLLALADIGNLPVTGTVSADGKVSGTAGAPRIEAQVTATNGALDGEPFDRFTGTLNYAGNSVELANAQLAARGRTVTLEARYQHQAGHFDNGQLHFQVDTNAMPLAQFQVVSKAYPGINGTAELHASGVVDIVPARPGQRGFRLVSLNGTLRGRRLRINDQPLRAGTLTVATKGSDLTAHFNSEVAGSVIQGDGQWSLTDDYPGHMQVSFKEFDLERLRVWLRGKQPPGGIQLTGSAEGTLAINGPALQPNLWKAQLRIPSLKVGPGAGMGAQGNVLALHNAAPIVISMERDVVRVESARMVGRATDLSLTGAIDLQAKSPMDLRVGGRFDLASLQDFNQDVYGSGLIETGVTIKGPLAQPQVSGRLDIKDATINLSEIPVGISNTNGVILFDGSRATIQSLSGESGGGKVTLTGFAGYGGNELVFRLHATAEEMRVRYPEDFSTVANASLGLTGTSNSSMLSGRITVLRTGFNPRSDFSSILAKSAEPVRTPSAQTGLLANMHFDVQIDSAPDITFQSSLAQGLQAEASLRLRGTGTNPSLLGRIQITGGQLVFFGTAFTVNQGSIAFYNPVKIEPVLNLDLDTKARGIDVILNIAGPINKLNLTPRSDPPMPFSDIVALLATGRSPTSDYATLMSGPAAPQSMQQLGASALLGEAIASPVTGRLQRFFGVTRLKIDPTLTGLTGIENNPQARLTIEQQVTPEITFTYITDVTSTNPLVVQVEWTFSRHWSAVALREENGLVGLDFVYKRRFK